MLVPIILGSQSPRRRTLLSAVAQPGQLRIMPPLSSDEPGFENLTTTASIDEQLRRIVQMKFEDVSGQLRQNRPCDRVCVVCADTIVVAAEFDGSRIVLGKPPESDWQPAVRRWFRDYYCDRPHEVWTAFCAAVVDSNGVQTDAFGQQLVRQQTVKTTVQFHAVSDELIEWYLGTQESVGKAGGYGLQDHAAMFVKSISGSITGVVGLPMLELTAALHDLKVLQLTS
ncbi:MAG: Maf family protein [Planctomycetaceae bacterium]